MIAAISWSLASLTGLGGLTCLLLFRKKERVEFLAGEGTGRCLTLFLMVGILVNLAVGLGTGSLELQIASAWIGIGGCAMIICASAIVKVAQHERSLGLRPLRYPRQVLPYGAAAFAFILVSLSIFAAPLFDWDARSIWFFHGKAVFLDHGLHSSSFWANDEYNWSHKDYPPLIPLFAAQAVQFTLGAWNEYAPKGGLVPLAAAGLFGLLATSDGLARYLFLLMGIVAVLGAQLWDGYADGWLALMGCITIAALARWAETAERYELLLGCAALAAALCLKNEGELLLIVAAAVFSFGAWRNRKMLQVRDAAIVLLFCPAVLWVWRKATLGAKGDLEAGDVATRALGMAHLWPELSHRLFVLAQATLASSFLAESLAAYAVLGCCFGWRRGTVLIGGAAVLYTFGLVTIYLGTPQEFDWHVRTSLDRVLMFPTLLLLIGVSRMVRPSLIAGETTPAAGQRA